MAHAGAQHPLSPAPAPSLHPRSNQSRLVIPSANLSSLGATAYKVSASVKNQFGNSKDAVATFTVDAAGAAPLVSVVGITDERKFSIKDGFKISTIVAEESVCAGKTVSYLWVPLEADGTTPWSLDEANTMAKTFVAPGETGARLPPAGRCLS